MGLAVWLRLPISLVGKQLAVAAGVESRRQSLRGQLQECVRPLAAADSGSAYVARANADRAVGVGYPTVYGRYAGATRAVPMTVPSQTMLVDPYVKMPVATAKGYEAMLQSLKVGSAESRDLYAASNGDIYRRQEGKWYRADTKGGWAYVTPAIGPMTHPYHPATAAYYDHPNAYRPAEMAGDYHRPYEAAAMDQDYRSEEQ